MTLIYRHQRRDETLVDWRGDDQLVIVYDEQQLPVSITPTHQHALAAVHVAYDVTGHVTWWRRGDVVMTYVYDGVSGQLTEWTTTSHSDQRQRLVYRYVYDEHSHVVSDKHRCRLEIWANAQRDGRPAEYRWRPLFDAAKFPTPTARVPCSNAAKTRNPLISAGVPQTRQRISATIL